MIYSVCVYDSSRECLYDIICIYECIYEFVYTYTRARAHSRFVSFCARTRLSFSPFPSLFLSLTLSLSLPSSLSFTNRTNDLHPPHPFQKKKQEQWVTLTA